MIDGFTKIVKSEGPLALYKGMSVNLIKVIPFAALEFTLKDELTKAFIRIKSKKPQKK